ncbi:type II toxin-antitoxin system prevent-host-death family antitoxin [Clostridium estertheticum]|uniref:type II toxin-antitoxin system Phd/YefM family antitoxin n=1 Tax=Clostridium estertheticum TaxID=238834 RepID=UPI001C0C0777|nr:type II toxin-antitoxin system Phd/YefM family antitoxin [Clostridium estertheticum]MBU3215227.1 type II toxin-antitoxin system prevent-host-death family antitoxin [Clostridium estertheticum]WAG56860.1 type II toxin-antitoxin system prevent-host-death family antitoxin [Clostridium estertheticum]
MLYDILPVSDLRNKFPEISNICLTKNRPVILTKNGKGSMVLLSIAEFDKQQNELGKLRAEVARLVIIEKELVAVEKVYGNLLESEISENGNDEVINHEDFIKQMKARVLNAEHNNVQSSL